MGKFTISGFIVLFILILAVMDSGAANRTALVIGNGKYLSSPLANPVNDARDMAKMLESCGFKVTLKTNASLRAMETAIRSFGTNLREGGIGLFYYAGHGLQVKGNNYLIPVGATIESEADVKYEAVNAGLVLAKMEDARNNLNIVILDACRNNPFARGFRSPVEGLARMDAPTGSLIAYATAPGRLAADGEGRNGIYTKHLIDNMKKPGLTIEQVLKNVRVAVLSETDRKQTPWEASSLTGYFYFKPEQGKKESRVELISPAENQIPDQCNLFVNTEPEGARVRILNIKPKFFQGIELVPGKYYIEASLNNHVTQRQWISINHGEQKTMDMVLNPLQDQQAVVDKIQIQPTQNPEKKESMDLETLLARAKLEKKAQER
jgi:hypothetical protein